MPGPRHHPLPGSAARLLGVAGLLVALAGCKRGPPPGAEVGDPAPGEPGVQAGAPVLPPGLGPATAGSAAAPGGSAAPSGSAPAPYAGPYLIVTDPSAGVYSEPSLEKKAKIGYLRSGGKVPVLAGTVAKDNCSRGWYHARDGGFVCANVGTTNAGSPEARFAIKAPDPAGVLPYMYARNAKNGTPLYRSVPTAEQMREYEPYLVAKPKEERDLDVMPAQPKKSAAAAPIAAAIAPADSPLPFSKEAIEAAKLRPAASDGTGGAPATAPAPPELLPAQAAPDGGADDTPWWQREDADKRLHEVKLDELSADADAILAKRMVKGFYVAVDRQFNWNGRPWYKTTKGLVAPADRFWITKGSEFHGVALDGEKLALPMGFTYGYQKSRPKYSLDAEGKLTPDGSLEYHVGVALTGKEKDVGKKKYVETREGFWVLASHLRITRPSPPPADLTPTERWIDVNLTTQTVVAFEGTKAVYASLVSSGKESKIEEKDHRTPTGEWRIREKHVTTTMDGDGSAAGDLPYSIEDVPYVMYFHKAFALHGAFWHSNYGVQMSHGCVNLSPLDAKWVFDFTEPHVPEGWHGVWAGSEAAGSEAEREPQRERQRGGSRVVIHE